MTIHIPPFQNQQTLISIEQCPPNPISATLRGGLLRGFRPLASPLAPPRPLTGSPSRTPFLSTAAQGAPRGRRAICVLGPDQECPDQRAGRGDAYTCHVCHPRDVWARCGPFPSNPYGGSGGRAGPSVPCGRMLAVKGNEEESLERLKEAPPGRRESLPPHPPVRPARSVYQCPAPPSLPGHVSPLPSVASRLRGHEPPPRPAPIPCS